MGNCFKGTEEFIAVYIDDILVFSHNEKEHAEHLRKLLDICKTNGLVLSPTKMKITVLEIEFLSAILGRLLSPLYAKTSPTGDKRLNNQDWALVKRIKKLIQTLPDLKVPPEECFIILETDGCMEGWGGICKWKRCKFDPRTTEKVCAYASGKFNPPKSTIDVEIHAVMNSLKALKIYFLDKESAYFEKRKKNKDLQMLEEEKDDEEELQRRKRDAEKGEGLPVCRFPKPSAAAANRCFNPSSH
ncbi:hypothetical protein ZIOFF_048306 [Zingiber officinale]|uniref:Reverse transcriptase domain-containing protein n=1 Tax=Zingiber officinale TaxID=94328 RepID=A0A8J5KXJ1_ZINOF|nr:hypothetical protein ZIOFF_048306 [Zingiber officinale]